MEKLKLTQENYYSQEADLCYMSYSQFKDFLECESQALAIVKGLYKKPEGDALLQGSYVDAYFSGEMEKFKNEHPEIFKKDGTLLAKFEICNQIVKTIEEDDFFKTRFYGGNAQTILTGEIAGVPFKCKIDQFYPGSRIVDMKCMKDVNDIWDSEIHAYVRFWQKYGYHIQAAIYRELVRQNYGETLPYYLAVATKETPVQKHAYLFDPALLDDTLKLVETLAPRFQTIKLGDTQPNECGKCAYYHSTHKLDIFDVEEIKKEDLR